jgi:putative flippase GtrA
MKLKFQYLKNKYFDYSMLRWALVGVTTTAIDYLLFINFYNLINSVFISNLLSGSVATSINYFTHHRWTFRSQQVHPKSGIKYSINLTFWWFISTGIIKLMIELNFDPRIAKLTPFLVIVPINYFVLRNIVFKKNLKRF